MALAHEKGFQFIAFPLMGVETMCYFHNLNKVSSTLILYVLPLSERESYNLDLFSEFRL